MRTNVVARLKSKVLGTGFAVAAAAALGSLVANGQPARSDASRSSAKLLFVARFASTCEPSDSPPNFQFDVYEDGRVRYFGGDLVREKGEREFRITSPEAGRLAERVRSSLSESDFDRHHPPGLPLNWGDNGKILEGRCLLLTAYQNGGGSAEGTILLESDIGDALDDRLNRALGVQALICPERTGGRLSKHCDDRSFGFEVARPRETCGWVHVVNFYRDGVVHYFVDRLPDSDQYFELDRTTINDLAEEAAALDGDTIVVPQSSRPPNPQYPRAFLPTFLNDAEATREFADRVAGLLRLEWQTTPLAADPTRCVGPGAGAFPRGSIWLPPSLLSR